MKQNIFIGFASLCFFLSGLSAQQPYPVCGTGSNPVMNSPSQPQSCDYNISNFISEHGNDMVPQGITTKVRIRTNVIFVQKTNGEGNFSISNAAHMAFWSKVFALANQKLENLIQESCFCTTPPDHYSDIRIEFVPNFIEVRDNYAWDHTNDPDPLAGTISINSYDKPYLNYINALAEQTPGYQDGINVMITTDGPAYNTYVYDNPENKPLWELGYSSFYGGYWYSAFPTFDFTRPPMWHAPDAYLWYINGYDHLGGDWWLDHDQIPYYAGVFLHEYGHYLGLPHISCANNIMRAGPSSWTSLSGCQVRQMYMSLMAKNLRKTIICNNRLDYSLNIDSDETWSLNLRLLGNVKVKAGATLTIKCEVHMPPHGQIIVERGGRLIVDGGLITDDCSGRWSGIKIEGDVSGKQFLSGKVILKNSAIVENARDAISMNPIHIPWNDGAQQDYYGGIVEAENSTIRRCVRGVEFMKYGSLGTKDKSWFNNVLFEDLEEGVTIWADDGVTFDNCTFKQIAVRGIHPYDSEVIVREGNTFEDLPIGVDVLTTYPIVFSSRIGKFGGISNEFDCQLKGVNIMAAGNIGPLAIYNNVFTGGNNGVAQNGNGLIYIQNNEFSGQLTAIEVYEAGYSFNHVKGNEVNNCYIGAHTVYNNIGMRYFDNCFSGSQLVDVYVSDGPIYPYQGDEYFSANNCFTKNDIPEIDNHTGTGLVVYYTKTGTPTNSCKYPNELSNVTLGFASAEIPATCGPNLFTPDGGSEYYCEIDETRSIAKLKQQRDVLIQELSTLPANTQSYEKTSKERCREVLESLIGIKMLAPDSQDPDAGKESAIQFFSGTGMDFKDRANAYGIMVSNGELIRARTFLTTMNPQNTEENDFIAVQNINLDFLSQPFTYMIDNTTKEDLYEIGTSAGPFTGYARALYEVLTGERIEVSIPEVVVERSGMKSINQNQAVIHIYPNLVENGTFNIVVANLPQGAVYQGVLTDITGGAKSIFLINDNGSRSIDCGGFHSGVYYLSVRDNSGHQIFLSKLFLIN